MDKTVFTVTYKIPMMPVKTVNFMSNASEVTDQAAADANRAIFFVEPDSREAKVLKIEVTNAD